MRFIHSNKQYIERTMYPINPYMNAPAVAPLTMEAFVAPADFDPDAQELNIVKAFAAYPNANKKYIFSVGTSATTEVPYAGGRSYAYSENGGAYTTITNGTITWTVGSTKRHVIGIDSNSAIDIYMATNLSLDGVKWIYLSLKCQSLFIQRPSLKYIHCESLNSIQYVADYSYFQNYNLQGVLSIGRNTAYIGKYAFSETSLLQYIDLSLADSLLSIGRDAFIGCAGISGQLIFPATLQKIVEGAFQNCIGISGALNIPNSVTYLGAINDNHGAFYNCVGITSINIFSTTLSVIGKYAFGNCSSVNYISIHTQIPPSILGTTFGGVNKNIPLHVPVGSLAAYQAAQYWNEFTNIIADL